MTASPPRAESGDPQPGFSKPIAPREISATRENDLPKVPAANPPPFKGAPATESWFRGSIRKYLPQVYLVSRRASTAAPVMPALSPSFDATISTPFMVPGIA